MKELADGQGSLLEEPEYFGERSYLAAATARFPELEEELTRDPGIHIVTSVLARATMEAIELGSLSRVCELFAFLDGVLMQTRLHPEIPNAIADSYVVLSELRVTAVGRSAIELLPVSIRKLISVREVR